jgi:Tfp pilus assembly protein PilO
VTTRDRLLIVAVLAVAAIAGFWFVGMAPKRKDAADLQAQIDTTSQQLAAAQQKANEAAKAKANYDADYATVAKLGKAVPASDGLPSLLYQLQVAAHDSRIDFRSLKLSAAGGQGPVATTPATSSAGAPSSTGGASSSSASSSSSSSSSTPPATGATSTPPATGATSTPPATGATSAPATQASAATLPPGASVGSAGFPTMPFSFVFNGSFFDMETFMRDVNRLVRVNGTRIDVRGRLLSIDGFALTAGPGGFPKVKASITATAYLRAPGDDAPAPDASATASSSSPATSASSTAAPASSASSTSEVAR